MGNPPIHLEGALDFLPETYVNRVPLRALVALCETSNGMVPPRQFLILLVPTAIHFRPIDWVGHHRPRGRRHRQ